ncbi:unnamed protein product, partial [marine sediment metagenome]
MINLAAQLLTNAIIAGSLYALAGISWGIIYGTTRVFHYAHMLIFTAGGYAAWLAVSKAQLPLPIGFVAGVLAAVIVGCGIERGLYRPLRSKGATQIVIFLASLGTATVGAALVLLFWGGDPHKLSGFPMQYISIGPVGFTNLDVFIVVFSWMLFALLVLYLR